MVGFFNEAYIIPGMLKIKRLTKDLPLPKKVHSTDAGIDLYSAVYWTLEPGEKHWIPTGIILEFPVGYFGMIVPRSGLAEEGISIVNSPGIVDEGFTGEVKAILINQGNQNYYVQRGDRIAQLIIRKQYDFTIQEVDELTETDRGNEGFGSSGV